MKISELARRSDVTIPTIKYYIREGLLQPGSASAPNQACYDESHLEDLALIRALREHAGIPISAIRRVLQDVSAAGSQRDLDSLAAGVRRVESERIASRQGEIRELDRDDPEYRHAWRELSALMAESDWRRNEGDPEVQELLAAMVAVRHVWPYEIPRGLWKHYAELGEQAASFEIPDAWDPDRYPRETLRYAIVGTYLFEPVILAFRRMALAERSMQLQRERRRSASPETAELPWMMPRDT